ncbi:MAG TPA: pantetheine-phosphate adenylyltransferase [Gaiellales bacterium]|jgi:pantetheine-phosphate adenylyltransferase
MSDFEPEPTLIPGRTALCPGSYDPVTYGHIDVIRRAAPLFDRLVVSVVDKPRHKTTTFSVSERIEFLRDALVDLDSVIVGGFSGLLVEYARQWGAVALVKGLRAVSDYEWEFQMGHLNKRLAPEIETVYLMSSPQYSFLSSSGVKEIAAFGGTLDDLVPSAVARALAERTAS